VDRIFDDLLGIAKRAPDAEERIEKLREALEKPGPRAHPCSGALVLDTQSGKRERRRCENHCERYSRPDGRVYYMGLCSDCNDLEWSDRWSSLFQAAVKAGDERTQRYLTNAAEAYQKRGRRFTGQTATSKKAAGT
jgi:hypothetical protein